MAAVQPKLVHKQFNSPIGLYSEQNVKETLERELKAFGMDGIELDQQTSKPLNLANSAVLRAVEEEEEMKCGYKRVAWPPVSEERIVREFTPQPQTEYPPQQQQQLQLQQQQQQQQAGQQPQLQQQQQQQQLQQQQQQKLHNPENQSSDSPGIITLRKEAPLSQKPAPVITSQPAALSYRGGTNMRGDLKWPPPEYKEQAEREAEERRQLALGPACRPTKVKRDYTQFFAKNRTNCYYPGYKIPPGTQHILA